VRDQNAAPASGARDVEMKTGDTSRQRQAQGAGTGAAGVGTVSSSVVGFLVDRASTKRQLQGAVTLCSERGLAHSAKW
jgi:hypothetical protein